MSSELNAKAELILLTPRWPNFVRVKGGGPAIPIEDLSEEAIDELILSLRLHIRRRRKRGAIA